MKWLPARPNQYPEWLEVIRLGRSDWRVSDGRGLVGDPGRLLGYVERLGPRRFGGVGMGEPVRWGYVDSLGGALVGIAEPRHFTGTIEPRRDRPVAYPWSALHRTRR